MLINFACFFVICGFSLKLTFSRKSFRNTIRVSNNLDPDQVRHFVGPDLGPDCLQRLLADAKVATSRERVMGLRIKEEQIIH